MAIPFISKALLRRRVRKLEGKTDKLGKKLCDLADLVKEEKAKAANLLVKSDYDRTVASLDRHLKDACACAKEAGDDPTKEEKEEAGKPFRECRNELNRDVSKLPGQKPIPGWEKLLTPEQRKLVDDCMKAG